MHTTSNVTMKLNEIKLLEAEEFASIQEFMAYLQNKARFHTIENEKTPSFYLRGDTINCEGDIMLNYYGLSSLTKLPYKFGVVDGIFNLTDMNLATLENCPHTVNALFDCAGCEHLTSFDGAPKKVVGNFYAQDINIQSLIGIADHIHEIGFQFVMDFNTVRTGGLGLLSIKKLQSLKQANNKTLAAPFIIINKHLAGNRDIFECQTELIEAGFEEFAQL